MPCLTAAAGKQAVTSATSPNGLMLIPSDVAEAPAAVTSLVGGVVNAWLFLIKVTGPTPS